DEPAVITVIGNDIATTIDVRDTPPPAAPVTPPETKIAVRDFDFYYGSFKALHGITLDIPARQVTASIGPSGCGKSTFIRSINRMNDIIPESHVSGTITIDGKDVYARGTDPIATSKIEELIYEL